MVLKKEYFIKSSVKDAHTLKSDSPKNTVKRIESGFLKLGIKLDYKLYSRKNSSIYWGSLSSELIGSRSLGKGFNKELTKASAYAEMAERFSARLHHYHTIYVTKEDNESINLKDFLNFKYLPGYIYGPEKEIPNAIRIDSLFVNNEVKYDLDKIKNADISKHWVDGFSLIHNKRVKVPLKLIKRISTSGGIASGNTFEEAIVHASNEIFEYTAVSLALKSKKELPTISISSIKDKVIIKMIKYYNQIGYDIILKDFSCKNIFPCIGVLFIKRNGIVQENKHQKIICYRKIHAGASFNPEEAIKRALTEFVQGVKDNINYDLLNPANFMNWLSYNNLIETHKKERLSTMYTYYGDLSFLERGVQIKICDLPYKETFDFYKDIEEIKKICKIINSDLIVINQTHPILNFPVVRVIIPGYSDKLNYFYNVKSDDIINTNYPFETGPIFDRFFNNKLWNNPKKTRDELLYEIKGLLKNEPHRIRQPIPRKKICNKKISIEELLLYIYIENKDLNNFKMVLDFLPGKGEAEKHTPYYLRLFRLRQFNRLKKEMKKDHLIKTINISLQNPFGCQCNESCKGCESKIKPLNQVIKTFFGKNNTNNNNR
jgi:ribosomal protein S12 methylthiotransferase accessory factor